MRFRRLCFGLTGIIMIIASLYFFQVIAIKSKVLEYGVLKDALVSRLGQKPLGGSKTLSVTYNGKEYYQDSNFGKYGGAKLGDTVKVYTLKGSDDVVIYGVKRFLPDYILNSLLGGMGIISFFGLFFYRDKVKQYNPRYHISRAKLNKSKFNMLLNEAIPSVAVFNKYNKISTQRVRERVQKLFVEYTELMLTYIDDGLKDKDDRMDVILNILVEDQIFGKQYLIRYFKKILRLSVIETDLIYFDMIDTIIMSCEAEKIEINNQLKDSLESYIYNYPDYKVRFETSMKSLLD